MDLFKKHVVVRGANFMDKVASEGLGAIIPKGEESSAGEKRDDKQIAGHDADQYGRKRLMFKDNMVWKLYDPNDTRGINELRFYEHIQQHDPNTMGSVIPNFYGTVQHQEEGAQQPGDYIKMENIFKALGKEVCLADVKIGDTPTPFEEKHKTGLGEEVDNAFGSAYKRMFVPGLDRDGFQVLGVKVKNTKTKEWEKYGKMTGRSTKLLGMDYIVGSFLDGCTENRAYRSQIINELCQDLQVIENWLARQNIYQFRGSSLVLAYVPESSRPTQTFQASQSLPAPQTMGIPPAGIPLAGEMPNTPLGTHYSMSHTPAPHPQMPHSSSFSGTVPQYQSVEPSIYPTLSHIQQLSGGSHRRAIVRLIDFNNWKESHGAVDDASLKGVQNFKTHLLKQHVL